MQEIALALQTAFLESRAKNPAYSKRAFARKLGIGVGAASEIMSGKRLVSAKMAARLADRLGILPPTAQRPARAVARKVLALEQFELISDLEHFYVLKSLETKNPPRTVEALAERLGVAVSRAQALVTRLEDLGYVKRQAKGWKRLAPHFDTPDHVSSAAIRASHRRALARAEAALDAPPEARDFSILLEVGSSAQLPRLRQMIREFQDQVHAEFARDKGNQVFQLNVQLFPVLKEKETI